MHQSTKNKTTILSLTIALFLAALPSAIPDLQSVSGTTAHALWHAPLGSPLRVHTPYDLPNGPYQAGHRGIDITARGAAQVASPVNGVVSYVGTVVDRPVISIKVDERTTVSLEPLTSELVAGDAVARGQPLGLLSTGGHCTTECLHLGVRVDGNYVNPLRFFIARAVLVPW